MGGIVDHVEGQRAWSPRASDAFPLASHHRWHSGPLSRLCPLKSRRLYHPISELLDPLDTSKSTSSDGSRRLLGSATVVTRELTSARPGRASGGACGVVLAW